MRKQFVFIRFGINNYDYDWFEWRLNYLENISIQGLENNAHDNLYIVFAINRNAPLNARRKLINIFENSKVKSNFHVIEIDLHSQIVPAFLHFLKLHVYDGERFMLARLDTDDLWAPGLLKYIDEYDMKYNDTDTMAYTFPEGIELFVNGREGYLNDKPRGSMNNFVYTTDQSICPYQYVHGRIHLKASEKGWRYVEVRNEKAWWLRALTDDNTFEWELGSQFYNNYMNNLKKSKTKVDWMQICNLFQIDNQRASTFFNTYKTVPSTSGFLAYRDFGTIGNKAKKNMEKYQKLIDIIVENFSYDSTYKPKTREFLSIIMKDKLCTYKEAVGQMISNSDQAGANSDNRYPLTECLDDAVNRIGVTSDVAIIIVLSGKDISSFTDVCNKFEYHPPLDIIRTGNSVAALWDGVTWSVFSDDDRLHVEHTLIDEPKTLHLRIMACGIKGKETGQVFVCNHKSLGKSSNEWDWSMNEIGVNVVAVSLKKPGYIVDTFSFNEAQGEVRRVYCGSSLNSFGVNSEKFAVIDEGWYTIKTNSNKKYSLDIRAGSPDNGRSLQLYTPNNSNAQKFFIKNVGNNDYVILTGTNSLKSRLCTKGGNVACGITVQQFESGVLPELIWNIMVNEDDSMTFIVKNSNLALDISGSIIKSNVKMILYNLNNSNTQKFVLSPTDN